MFLIYLTFRNFAWFVLLSFFSKVLNKLRDSKKAVLLITNNINDLEGQIQGLIDSLKVSEDNSLQFSIDILNFGNLISSDWGLVQQPNAVQPIGVSVDGSGTPTYTFSSDLKDTFVYDASLLSRWQMQFGLRYIF